MPRRIDASFAPGSGRELRLLALGLLLALMPLPAQAQTRPTADPQVRPASLGSTAIRRPESPLGSDSRRGPSGGWSTTIGLTALSLAAIGTAGWVLARRRESAIGTTAGRARGETVRVLSRTMLTPKHAIHVVQAGERLLLIGTGTTGAPTLLGDLPPAEAASVRRIAVRPTEGGP
jgi:hypothetical protein